ncbi:DUF3877 family protein [Blautia stercoris]|nr:DUF3877 family protein [Blautia stercoris]
MKQFLAGFEALKDNILDAVIEQQAKLGYRKEPIRLYYPLSSLNHFFNTTVDSEELQQMLSEFPAYTKEQCGEISATHKNDRFCFTVSEEVSEYVHNNKAQNTFIIDLIELLSTHGTKLEDVIEHFKAQQKEYVVEPVDNGEFDIFIRFVNDKDRYYYCFKDEGCHIIYHRFLPEDYADFDF